MANEQKSVAETKTATTERIINVVTTRGEKTKISFTGDKWSDLKTILEKGGKDVEGNSFSGYSLNNMKCVESTNRTTLEHVDAKVPEGNFNLFLMPYKTKSGGEAREAVKKLFEANRDAARAHFGNYTQVKEEALAELLKTYVNPGVVSTGTTVKASASNKATVTDKSKQQPKKNVADVVASVKDSHNSPIRAGVVAAIAQLQKVLSEIDGQPQSSVADTKPSAVSGPAAQADVVAEVPKKSKEEIEREAEAERKRLAKIEEDKELDAEMLSMSKGFNDVDRDAFRR